MLDPRRFGSMKDNHVLSLFKYLIESCLSHHNYKKKVLTVTVNNLINNQQKRTIASNPNLLNVKRTLHITLEIQAFRQTQKCLIWLMGS